MSLPLIYLTGMPRSGTTWLGKIFDSHPDTLYRHEPDSRGELNTIPFAPDVENRGAYRSVLEAFLATVPHNRSTKVSASLPVFNKHYYSPMTFGLRKLAVLGAKLSARAITDLPVPAFASPARHPATKLVWKSIESTARLGVIARLVPDFRAVHIMRHPCGYIASVLRGQSGKQFSESDKSSEDFRLLELLADTPQAQRYGMTIRAIRELAPVERLAWRWAIINEKALDDSAGLPNCTTLRYETLCESPEYTTRMLFDFCGLEWHAQTHKFLQDSTSSSKKAYYSIVKNPLVSANKWRDQLDAPTISAVTSTIEDTRAWQFYARKLLAAA